VVCLVVGPLNFTVTTRVDGLLAPCFFFLGFLGGGVLVPQMLRWGALL
jgi:hypothetical protein